MILKTSNSKDIQPFLKKLVLPVSNSHKGQNGKALIIGGSTLFHAASLWAAEIASHFLDMVHYSSTEENNEIFLKLKTIFRNGIIVHKKDIEAYVEEDDAVLIGPGMVRGETAHQEPLISDFNKIVSITDEAKYSRHITHYLLHTFPHKRFVIDAGALQMMDREWLKKLKQPAIITPHQGEFLQLFGVDMNEYSFEEKIKTVETYAAEYNCIILLKTIHDIISDGTDTYVIEGGNQGLTKGGSGDILAGMTVSLYTKNDPITSAVISSYMEKLAADELKKETSYWYNMIELIHKIPKVLSHSLSISDTM